jgi:hypothetical protein
MSKVYGHDVYSDLTKAEEIKRGTQKEAILVSF